MHPLARALVRTAIASALTCLGSAQARNLLDDFVAASTQEPAFAAAQMQTRNMRIDASVAGSAYFPRAGISFSQDSIDNSTRRTARVVQPIVSADRWLTTREATPRETIANQLDAQSRIELANRVFGAVRDLALSREKLALYQANLQSLEAQNQSAVMANKLGQGTITDVLDTQLRLAQARSQILRLQADHEAARRAYANITGYSPARGAYPLSPRKIEQLNLPSLQELIDQTLQSNPRLLAERQATQLTSIQARRARAQFLPSLNATWQRSQTTSATSNLSGLVLSLDLPLQMSSVYAFESADNNLLAQQQKERATLEGLQLDVERLHALAVAAQEEVAITREGMDAAALSVTATEQSFAGGVRSKLDVLNALQAELSAREAHLNAQMNLAQTLLTLRLLAAHDIPTVLADLQRQLFDGA